MSASIMLVPTAKAALTIPTFAYVSVSTNPVGAGQSVEIIMWLNQVIFNAAFGNNIRLHNYQLTITPPNGSAINSDVRNYFGPNISTRLSIHSDSGRHIHN